MKINVEVVASKTYKATINVDAFIKMYDDEWMDFRAQYSPDKPDLKKLFIKEAIHEMGTDFFENSDASYIKFYDTDTDLEVELR